MSRVQSLAAEGPPPCSLTWLLAGLSSLLAAGQKPVCGQWASHGFLCVLTTWQPACPGRVVQEKAQDRNLLYFFFCFNNVFIQEMEQINPFQRKWTEDQNWVQVKDKADVAYTTFLCI